VFSMATTKRTGLIKPLINFGLLFVLLRARYSQFVSFFRIAADFLQVTIVFVLKIFSFVNKDKVLGDISTGIVGLGQLYQDARRSR